MATLFSRIASGEIPSFKVAENQHFFAFLDISPLAAGHTLVIPKQEVDYIFDMKEDLYLEFWQFAGQVAAAIKKSIPCIKVGIAVIGLEVPHAHIHLVPLNTMEDINFSKTKLQLPAGEMAKIASSISEQLK